MMVQVGDSWWSFCGIKWPRVLKIGVSPAGSLTMTITNNINNQVISSYPAATGKT